MTVNNPKRQLHTALLSVSILLVATLLYGFVMSLFLHVETVSVKADVVSPIRIVHLTDLHNAQFGKNNEKLVDKDGRFIAGMIADVDKGAYGFVDAIFVEEPLRHQGLGTYFLQEVEKLAKANDTHMILTTAGDWNVEFFKKNGYLLRGELKDVPKGHDCYELYKMI